MSKVFFIVLQKNTLPGNKHSQPGTVEASFPKNAHCFANSSLAALQKACIRLVIAEVVKTLLYGIFFRRTDHEDGAGPFPNLGVIVLP